MEQNNKAALQAASPYNATITREQFLFYEVRTTAKLLNEGYNSEEVVERIISDNLFQYPTEGIYSCIRFRYFGACYIRIVSTRWACYN